jgi:hypothetical protein
MISLSPFLGFRTFILKNVASAATCSYDPSINFVLHIAVPHLHMSPSQKPEYQAMASMSPPTTALAASNTPTRRASYKDNTDAYESSLDEKKLTIPRSNNPFDDMHYTSEATTSPAASDIEAQDNLPFKPKPKQRSRFRICFLLFCFILFWGVLIVGVIWVLDMVFPGAVRYDKIKELKDELLDTEKTVAMLKSQVSGMAAYLDGLKGSFMGGGKGVDGLENVTMPVSPEGGVVPGPEAGIVPGVEGGVVPGPEGRIIPGVEGGMVPGP